MRPIWRRLWLVTAIVSLIALPAGLAGFTMLLSLFQRIFPSLSADHISTSLGVISVVVGGVLAWNARAAPEVDRLPMQLLDDVNFVQLVALVALAVLFFVLTAAIVYLLIRRGPRKHQTETKTETKREPASPVVHKTGTVLNEGRYVILGPFTRDTPLRKTESGAYEVRATTSLSICPRCYSLVGRHLEAGAAEFSPLCPDCGGILSYTEVAAHLQMPANSPSEEPTLIAREISAERFAALSQLLARKLEHRAVVMPLDAFSVAAPDGPRYYQIEPAISHTVASEIDIPQALEHLLGWGESLAHGLAYLHHHQIVLQAGALASGEIGDPAAAEQAASMIVADGSEARWLCFDNVGPMVPDNEPELLRISRQNVRALAACLLKLATGETESGALDRLPDPVKVTLGEALSHDTVTSAADFATLLAQNRRELAYQEPVRLRMGARSNVGRVRKLNEDSMLAKDYSDVFGAVNLTVGLVAVADGVGGNSAGDVASRLTVEALADFGDSLRQTSAEGYMPDPEPWISQAAAAANLAVYRERQAVSSDMGSTLVTALVVGSSATLLNVGDSRGYRLGPQSIEQITTDHSLVQRLIDIGQLTREEARHHPQKSIIYRVIGDTADLAYDTYDVILQPGEALLLCSDGLTDMVEDHVLWHVWRTAASPDEACRRLVGLANEAGGYDNITVVIVQIA